MDYISKSPAPPLADFVERFWQINDSPPHQRERILPSGTIELVINLREDEFRIFDPARPDTYKRFSGSLVSGTYSRPFLIDARRHSVIGIHFRPGGAFPFLGPAANELADKHVDLESLWGVAAKELHQRISESRNPAQRFDLLERALLRHRFRPLEHHYAVPYALSAFMRDSKLNVAKVAQKIGLSHRRFIHVFSREVGLSPKAFCLVRRFQKILAMLKQTNAPNWSQLAWDCGYFDQSHFIHDFRGFSNLNPTDFLQQRSQRVKENHVPVPA